MSNEEKNKMIKDFMQWDYIDDNIQTSYDWLIPVMQKIYMTATAMPKEYYNVTHTYAIAPIEEMYKTVVDFITWYNKNNADEQR